MSGLQRWRTALIVIVVTFTQAELSLAGVSSTTVRETVEFLLKRFAREAIKEGSETLSRKIVIFTTKYGDEVIEATRKVGPRALDVIEEAGENGRSVVKWLARHGDEATWVVKKPSRTAIFIKHGDDAADAMIRHGEMVDPVIETFGKPAARAFKVLDNDQARRLATMADDGSLAKIGRTDELLAVVEKYGDRAMAFIWRNKGGLLATTALAKFLQNPEPFINGVMSLGQSGLSQVVGPVGTAIATRVNWTWPVSIVTLAFAGLGVFKIRSRMGRSKTPGTGRPTSTKEPVIKE